MKQFLSELKRRNVLRVAAFYAAAGWLLVQIATQVLPVFEVPAWTMRVVVVAVILGFPFALLFAWLATAVVVLLANQFVPHRNRTDAHAKAIAVLPLANDTCD